MTVQAAVVQLTTTDDRAANRSAALCWVRAARDAGAAAVFLPEMWPFIGSDADKVAGAEALDGPSMTAMRFSGLTHSEGQNGRPHLRQHLETDECCGLAELAR